MAPDLQLIAARGVSATPLWQVRRQHFPVSLQTTVPTHPRSRSTFRCRTASPLPLGCTGHDRSHVFPGSPAPVGDDGSTTLFFQAAAGGMYTFVARLTDEGATDPNAANNEASVTVPIGEVPHALAAVGFHIAPTHPSAGGTFSVSFRVSRQNGRNRTRADLGPLPRVTRPCPRSHLRSTSDLRRGDAAIRARESRPWSAHSDRTRPLSLTTLRRVPSLTTPRAAPAPGTDAETRAQRGDLEARATAVDFPLNLGPFLLPGTTRGQPRELVGVGDDP